jgi:tetraacyldisaccharide 4'-kinase
MNSTSPVVDALLAIPAAGYSFVQKIREAAYRLGALAQQEAPMPVVSVGNLLMGGSGKTPFVIHLATLLLRRDFRPAVVSRGYRGTNTKNYLVVGEGNGRGPVAAASVSGDEPYLIACRLPEIPVIVGRRRIHPVRAARDLFACDVAVLDDGFQHLPLARNVDIVLLNGSENWMFPRGGLREPLSALKRAHIVVLVGERASVPAAATPYVMNKPVFRCRQVARDLELGKESAVAATDLFRGRAVVLASAIANPERFRTTAERLGWLVHDHIVYRDHHEFTDDELRAILNRASELPLVVTEKDWVKLPAWFRAMERVSALRIDMSLDDEATFVHFVLKKIGRE